MPALLQDTGRAKGQGNAYTYAYMSCITQIHGTNEPVYIYIYIRIFLFITYMYICICIRVWVIIVTAKIALHIFEHLLQCTMPCTSRGTRCCPKLQRRCLGDLAVTWLHFFLRRFHLSFRDQKHAGSESMLAKNEPTTVVAAGQSHLQQAGPC